MRFRILGPMEVRGDHRERLLINRHKERRLLGSLLLRCNEPVGVDELVDCLWEKDPPRSAHANLKSYVSHLRASVFNGSQRAQLRTEPGGYRVVIGEQELDALAFERLTTEGRDAFQNGDYPAAVGCFMQARGLWRGDVLEDLGMLEGIHAEVTRLQEWRMTALEKEMDIRLTLGEHGTLVAELSAAVIEHPYREQLWGQLMLALYRSNRRGDALHAYQRAYQVLDQELGIEPNRTLQRLHQQVLHADPKLERRRPAEFVAGRQPVPHQLPSDISVFTGRGNHLRRLDRLLDEQGNAASTSVRTVLLTGKAGIGKTALAVHWAHRIAGRFPDGQLFVDLQDPDLGTPVPPGAALGKLLRGLGVAPADIPDTQDERAACFRSLLAGKRILVLLEDAASGEQVRPLLPASPTCLVIVTSRTDLRSLIALNGAYWLPLSPLTTDEAIQLLAQLAGKERIDTEPAPAAQLCRLYAHRPERLRTLGVRLHQQPALMITHVLRWSHLQKSKNRRAQ